MAPFMNGGSAPAPALKGVKKVHAQFHSMCWMAIDTNTTSDKIEAKQNPTIRVSQEGTHIITRKNQASPRNMSCK